MATADASIALREKIASGLAFRDKSLEHRSQWGSITFERAAPDFRRVFEILSNLSVLPIESLTDAAVRDIQTEINHAISVFGRIDEFNIEQPNPGQVRDQLVGEAHTRADQLYTIATPWIPYLAYQKGDVAQNIETLTTSITQAQRLTDEAKTAIAKRQSEIDAIITQAREASAAAGAAVFTHDFKNEASSIERAAHKWLIATGVLALVTLVLAVAMWVLPIQGTDTAVVIQRFGGKLAMLVVLFTATLWCGRTYKSLMHLATVNRHRALSLQTFQAFSHAASDDVTRDAVLMETTRAIFGAVPTGFLDSKPSGDQDLKIIEVAKALGTKTSTPG